jgi:predicted nucleic acid-binding protein
MTIVIDANVAVWAVIPAVAAVNAVTHFESWRRARTGIHAPTLWISECTSVIRRYVFAGAISSQDGLKAIDDLFSLEVRVEPTTITHCRKAYAWAEQLGQVRAYDGFYLALAEEFGAEFYTADKKLVAGARQIGISWVRWIGDTTV